VVSNSRGDRSPSRRHVGVRWLQRQANVTVRMVRGTTTSECTQIARYNVESGRKIFAGNENYVPTHHGLEVQLAAIKAAADQLPTSDPVRMLVGPPLDVPWTKRNRAPRAPFRPVGVIADVGIEP
jgi:hypothetical protein